MIGRSKGEGGTNRRFWFSQGATAAISILFLLIVVGGAGYVLRTLDVVNHSIDKIRFSQASNEFVLLQAVDGLKESLSTYLDRPTADNLATFRYALGVATYEIQQFKEATTPKDGPASEIPIASIQSLTEQLTRLANESPNPAVPLEEYGPRIDDIVSNLQNSYVNLTYTAVVRDEAAVRQFGNLSVETKLVVTLIVASLVFVLIILWWQRRYLQILNRTRDEMENAKSLAEEASRAKSDFLAKMSHEIRTPLNAITGLAYLTLNYERDPRLVDYLWKIQGSANILLRIVNEVLDFSKIESRKLELDRIPFTLNEVFEGFFAVVGVKAQEKNLEILFDLDDGIPNDLVGDPTRLSEVLINIATNAVKFSDSGDIHVSVQPVERTPGEIVLEFSIQDHGIGMSSEEQTKIFEMFSQVGTVAERKAGGTGLGLAIAKELVEMMGGSIEVRSTPGAGSTFTFTVRLEVAPDAEPIADGKASGFEGIRALVVDDNDTARSNLLTMLDSLHVAAVGVASGAEAVQAVKEAGPDHFQLILVDYLMPELSGIATFAELRRNANAMGSAKLILITSDARVAQTAEADAVGLDAVLMKPLTIFSLRRTMVRLHHGEGGPGESVVAASDMRLPQGKGARVLVIDDNEVNRQIARDILERTGFRVTLVSSGRDALRCLETQSFGAVLMDLHMPDLDGYETTQAIRRRSEWRNLPVLAMTAHAVSEVRERCLAAGMNDFVPKPILPRELIAKLAQWTGSASSATEELAKPEPEARAGSSLRRLNWEAALGRVGGNEELLVRLLRDFLSSHQTTSEELREALRSGNLSDARSKAHSIKGVAGNLGAELLGQAAADLERTLSEGPVDEVAAAQLSDLERELEALSEELKPRL